MKYLKSFMFSTVAISLLSGCGDQANSTLKLTKDLDANSGYQADVTAELTYNGSGKETVQVISVSHADGIADQINPTKGLQSNSNICTVGKVLSPQDPTCTIHVAYVGQLDGAVLKGADLQVQVQQLNMNAKTIKAPIHSSVFHVDHKLDVAMQKDFAAKTKGRNANIIALLHYDGHSTLNLTSIEPAHNANVQATLDQSANVSSVKNCYANGKWASLAHDDKCAISINYVANKGNVSLEKGMIRVNYSGVATGNVDVNESGTAFVEPTLVSAIDANFNLGGAIGAIRIANEGQDSGVFSLLSLPQDFTVYDGQNKVCRYEQCPHSCFSKSLSAMSSSSDALAPNDSCDIYVVNTGDKTKSIGQLSSANLVLKGLSADSKNSYVLDGSTSLVVAGDLPTATKSNSVYEYNGTTFNNISAGINFQKLAALNASVLSDHFGNVIYAVNNTLYKYQNNAWKPLLNKSFQPNGSILTVATDSKNNIYIAGEFTDTSGNYNIEKITPEQKFTSLVGSSEYSKYNNYIYTLAVDNKDNLYAAGSFNDSSNDHYIAKYDSNDNVWSSMGHGCSKSPFQANGHFQKNQASAIRRIHVNDNGDIFVEGTFEEPYHNGDMDFNNYFPYYANGQWSCSYGYNDEIKHINDRGVHGLAFDLQGNVIFSLTKDVGGLDAQQFNGTAFVPFKLGDSFRKNVHINKIITDDAGVLYFVTDDGLAIDHSGVWDFSHMALKNPLNGTAYDATLVRHLTIKSS